MTMKIPICVAVPLNAKIALQKEAHDKRITQSELVRRCLEKCGIA